MTPTMPHANFYCGTAYVHHSVRSRQHPRSDHRNGYSIDQMQKTAKTVALFDVKTFTPKMKQMGDAIVKSAELVQEAVPLLGSLTKEATRLSALTEQISQLEGRADELHDEACAHFTRITRNRTRWRSLSATKSMTIWKRSLTDLMTSPTSCTALLSSTCNYFKAERRWTPQR